ncbi:hypothetical protein [Nitrospira sp. BLG_2]|uniref:hypothetical protein n=1 Tax=Nitrospira sp. BLG_2 TaxID=3397507 RepID=UPI003B9BAC3C
MNTVVWSVELSADATDLLLHPANQFILGHLTGSNPARHSFEVFGRDRQFNDVFIEENKRRHHGRAFIPA